MRMLDLFSGKFGWSKSFALRRWECVGVDLVRPSEIPEGCDFINMDILELESISEIAGAMFDFICASSPCENFSLFQMRNFHPEPPYPELGIRLFNHTRRICEESGVPYILENVRAAQQFVGKAVFHCGSFYLWGSAAEAFVRNGVKWGNPVIEGLNKGMKMDREWCRGLGGHGTSQRDAQTAGFATIPPELASRVADYAERLIGQRATA